MQNSQESIEECFIFFAAVMKICFISTCAIWPVLLLFASKPRDPQEIKDPHN